MYNHKQSPAKKHSSSKRPSSSSKKHHHDNSPSDTSQFSEYTNTRNNPNSRQKPKPSNNNNPETGLNTKNRSTPKLKPKNPKSSMSRSAPSEKTSYSSYKQHYHAPRNETYVSESDSSEEEEYFLQDVSDDESDSENDYNSSFESEEEDEGATEEQRSLQEEIQSIIQDYNKEVQNNERLDRSQQKKKRDKEPKFEHKKNKDEDVEFFFSEDESFPKVKPRSRKDFQQPNLSTTNSEYYLTKNVTFSDMLKSLDNFLEDRLLMRIELVYLNRESRIILHELSNIYNLQSSSHGKADHRYLVLSKTKTSRIPRKEEINAFRETLMTGTLFYQHELRFRKKNRKRDFKGREDRDGYHDRDRDRNSHFKDERFTPSPKGRKDDRFVKKTPKVVGGGASPIRSDNLGFQLLKEMGWKGGGLGANNEGIQDPITVAVKIDTRGLGYDIRF